MYLGFPKLPKNIANINWFKCPCHCAVIAHIWSFLSSALELHFVLLDSPPNALQHSDRSTSSQHFLFVCKEVLFWVLFLVNNNYTHFYIKPNHYACLKQLIILWNGQKLHLNLMNKFWGISTWIIFSNTSQKSNLFIKWNVHPQFTSILCLHFISVTVAW